MILKARVRAAPEDGKANAALCALLAKAFGVAPSRVRVIKGQTSRLKLVLLGGADAADITALLARFPKDPP